MKRSWLFLALAAVLVGILFLFTRGGPEDRMADSPVGADSARSAADAADAGEPRDQPDSSVTGSSADGVSDDDAASASALLLALDGEGLRLFDATTGSSRPLAFGLDGSAARSALVAVLGAEPVEEGFSQDCAASFLNWSDGLTVWIVRGSFVGWSLRDDTASMTTPTGVGIGSTRAELDDSYAAEVMQSSLGVEFVAGGLAGLLESNEDTARITHLWAGQTCIAR